MKDRELLELAAKAAGIRIDSWGEPDYYSHRDGEVAFTDVGEWNPLTDDGDALRLAVQLDLCIGPNFDIDRAVVFGGSGENITELHAGNKLTATRRAIVRAAAEIGSQS